MKTIKTILIAALLATVTITGHSEEKKDEPQAAPKPKVKMIFKKSESHQFSGSSLKGQLKKPELSYIYERKGLKEEQIVNIPDNFNDEIINGAGQL